VAAYVVAAALVGPDTRWSLADAGGGVWSGDVPADEIPAWADAEVVSVYSRRDALEDGVLVDVSEFAKEAGFKWPLAVTRGVWAILEPSAELKSEGQSWKGRAWDMFTILRYAIRRATQTDEVHFAPLFIREPGRQPVSVALWAKVGPGDDGEPAAAHGAPRLGRGRSS
jgi:hypothetical protein